MTREEELIGMLKTLKEQAHKSCKDTAILDVKIDSFIFVIDETIKALNKEPKTGHWIVDSATSSQIGIHGKKTFSYEVHCDKCRWKWAYGTDQKDGIPSKYCPNCGAEMGAEE